MTWVNRIIGEGEADPRALMPNPDNWRLHTDYQLAALREVLGQVGWVDRVLVNQTTGRLIDGHARVSEAIAAEETSVPVTYVQLSENEERIVLATYDPLAAMAESDVDRQLALVDQIDQGNQILAQFLRDLTPLGAESDSLRGMPELQPDDEGAFRSLLVNFANAEDVETFQQLLAADRTSYARIGDDTDSMWFTAADPEPDS